MHELTGMISQVSIDFVTGKPLVTFLLNEQGQARAMVDELRCQDKLSLKFGKFKQKRSLDANAYAWVLIGKIAEKTGVPKNEVYQNAVRNIGGNYEIVCVQDKALDSLCQMWQRNGIGWTTDTMPSKIEGCTNVFLYYGSSVFTVDQMTRLIDSIIADCKALGIETKSYEEIESLLGAWGK